MTEEQLNELSIFALRELARRTGVYAPTSKKKSELIKNIIEISEGKKEPYIAKTKQGRPPKDVGYSFADILMPKSHFNFAQNSNINSFSQKSHLHLNRTSIIIALFVLVDNRFFLICVHFKPPFLFFILSTKPNARGCLVLTAHLGFRL